MDKFISLSGILENNKPVTLGDALSGISTYEEIYEDAKILELHSKLRNIFK